MPKIDGKDLVVITTEKPQLHHFYLFKILKVLLMFEFLKFNLGFSIKGDLFKQAIIYSKTTFNESNLVLKECALFKKN